MRGNVFDLVLLAILIFFFGYLQMRRPRREFRLWLVAWTLVLCSVATWMWPFSNPHLQQLQECIRLNFLVLGSTVFVLSFGKRVLGIKRLSIYIAVLSLTPCILIDLNIFNIDSRPMQIVLVLVMEGLAAFMARHLFGKGAITLLLRVGCAVATAMLLLASWNRRPDLMLTVIVTELFLASALLVLRRRTKSQLADWAIVVGFLLWAAAYVANQFMAEKGADRVLLGDLWNLPKYILGFGMILSVVESDAAEIAALSEEYRLMFESNPYPMWIFDPEMVSFLDVNQAALEGYGYSRQQFLALSPYDLLPEQERGKPIEALMEERRTWRHVRSDGEVFDVELTGHAVTFAGKTAQFVTAMDITERERLNRDLVYRAQHDSLTGLANRLLLEDHGLKTFARSVRDGSRAALLTMDVDRFKQVNDTYGHPVGDECLKAIAARLSSRVRDADTLARTGGEEFTLLIGGLTSSRGAQVAAETMLASLAEPLKLSVNEIKASVSCGIAIFPDDGADFETIRQLSDKALYQAKRLGGGRIAMASDKRLEAAAAVDIELALRQAMRGGSMELAYQPIFNASGDLVGAEALLRGTDDCLRKAGPGAFIPIAEESGLILGLGQWVLEEACSQLAQWRKDGVMPDIRIAVNVSARQFAQEHFADQVFNILRRFDIPPHLLHLELTETTLMRDVSTMIRSMQRLSSAGVQFAIDDFGTGYSSLARLSELPISTLKIDRSFVVKLLESDAAVGIVRAIVNMSQHLQLQVVAEGVEQPEHMEMLLRLGCTQFQGYYLGRPMSAEALENAVQAHEMRFDPETFRLSPAESQQLQDTTAPAA